MAAGIVQALHHPQADRRGIVKTVKSARKLVDKKEAIVWDILEIY